MNNNYFQEKLAEIAVQCLERCEPEQTGILTNIAPAPFLDSSLRWNDDEEQASWIAIPMASVIPTDLRLATPLTTPPWSFRRRPESSGLTSHSRKAGMLVFEALINLAGIEPKITYYISIL